MLSTSLLRYRLRGEAIEPAYADLRYAELVRALLLRHEAFVGKRWRELEASIAAAPEALAHEPRLVAGLRRVIEESIRLEPRAAVPPRELRAAVFAAAARSPDARRDAVLLQAATELGLPAEAAAAQLYADRREERVIVLRKTLPSVTETLGRYNLRLLQGMLLHAERLRIETAQNVRAVYRRARLCGLIVEALPAVEAPGGLVLEVTGPLSLFHQTRKYGWALASLLPACAAAGRFRLEARLSLRGRAGVLTLTDADRVLSTHAPPRAFDSQLEERFLKDFLALGSRWTAAREEQLLVAGAQAFLPDFTFHTPEAPGFRVALEIVGYWTPAYLERKREVLAALRNVRLILCVDEKLGCGVEGLPFPCITFRRRVPAARVLEELERMAAEQLQER